MNYELFVEDEMP